MYWASTKPQNLRKYFVKRDVEYKCRDCNIEMPIEDDQEWMYGSAGEFFCPACLKVFWGFDDPKNGQI